MPSIIYRRLDDNWDPQRGQSLDNFLTDIEAVAQVIATRIKLLMGEWWEVLSTGTPLFQNILGVANTNQGVALLLRQRILAVPFVTGIKSMQVTYTPAGKQMAFSAAVETQFGTITLSTLPPTGGQAYIARPTQ